MLRFDPVGFKVFSIWTTEIYVPARHGRWWRDDFSSIRINHCIVIVDSPNNVESPAKVSCFVIGRDGFNNFPGFFVNDDFFRDVIPIKLQYGLGFSFIGESEEGGDRHWKTLFKRIVQPRDLRLVTAVVMLGVPVPVS